MASHLPALSRGVESSRAISPQEWTEAVIRAAEQPGFVRPVFQPIVDLRRGVVCGFEMLARFVGPPEATPDVWFAQAAHCGVAAQLEARMIRAGLGARSALPQNCFLTINVAPEALATPEVQAALAEHTRLHGIVIELTEHSRADIESMSFHLPPLRTRGAMIAIDDVGSGYSGLQQIGTLRPEFVKVDRALVTGLHEDPAKREMVESLGAVANRIDAWVVAEGVESQAEIEALIRMKVPLGQGFVLARPEPAMVGPEVGLSGWIKQQDLNVDSEGSHGLLWRDRPAVAADAGRVEIQAEFRADPEAGHLAVLDERHRPIGLIGRERYFAGEQLPSKPLLAVADDDPADLARRAMSRPAATRFDPLVCCDETGRYVGLIQIERLVEILAT